MGKTIKAKVLNRESVTIYGPRLTVGVSSEDFAAIPPGAEIEIAWVDGSGAEPMTKVKLEVKNVILYSPEHAKQHCSITLHGPLDAYGVKPGDFVTLTKVEPDHKTIEELLAEPKIKARIDQVFRDLKASGMCRTQEEFNKAFLSAFPVPPVAFVCKPDELETARAILEATEADAQVEWDASRLEAIAETLLGRYDGNVKAQILKAIANRIRDIP